MKIFYLLFAALFLLTGVSLPFEANAGEKDPGKNNTRKFPATAAQGLIGVTEDVPFDNPVDNIFHVNITDKLCPEDQVWLVYELDGVEDHTNVSRSINDQISVGGYLVKERKGWNVQQEKINPTWLHAGDNVIRFTIPENARHHYRIRNLRIEVSADGLETERIVFNKPSLIYYFDKAYVKGFFTGVAHDNHSIKIDGKRVNTFNGEFESVIDFPLDKSSCTIDVEAIFADGTTYCGSLAFSEPQHADHHYSGSESNVFRVEKYIQAGEHATLHLDGASLNVSAEDLRENALMSITTLRSFDIPALDAGMVNVTANYSGFRFLPHGATFASEVSISVPFDSAKIPDGYTAQDIRTYFFDEQSHHWVVLDRDTIVSGKIISKSFHFTDMINGILKIPESPEVEAYNSNSIKGIKAANPAASVNMISPPQSSSTGNASLSFPIIIPAGRKGLQPDLAASYSSSAGNGWLGVGWNISMPMISIDTRWGVPRYDPEKETETYSFNGNMLTPVAHRGALRNRVRGDEQFFPRIEGAFYKIMRHGNDPTVYWWEVTDKNGTRYSYGGSGNTFDPSAVLRTNESSTSPDKGHIAQWCLREVRDPNGNTVRYHYTKVSDVGVSGGSVPGWQIYIDHITYTGFQGSDGPYVVKFISESSRPDKIISANLGFKQVTGNRLSKIEVRYEGGNNPPLIRSYQFEYTQGAFFKTLLRSIKELDSKNEVFATHDFTYYDEVKSAGGYEPFADEETINTIGDEVNGGFLNKGAGFNDKASVLSGSQSENIGGGLAVTVGPNDQNYASKSNTAGINYSYSHSKSEGRILMIDITGDGLPDKVMMFKSGRNKTLRYRRQIIGPNGEISFSDVRPINGINEFLKETSNVHDFGIESNFGIFAGVNRSMTKSKTSVYFTDANGDGLMDVVNDGKVLFNRPDASGDPMFNAASAGTPNPIVPAGTLDGSLITVNPDEVQALKDQNPLHDMVRMWRAPYNGVINIQAPVNLIQDTTEERQTYATADGVKVSIQLKGQEPIWSEVISKDDYSVKAPQNVNAIEVRKNDAIYFRVQSIEDGAYDKVKWNPIIEYTQHNDTIRDANGKFLYKFNSSEDFLMAAEQTLAMPIRGKINIESQFIKPPTSDSVRVEVLQTHSNGTKTVLYSKTFDDQVSANESISIPSVPVNENDKFVFKVSASSNIRWNDIRWKPLLYYTESLDPDFTEVVDEQNNYLIRSYAVPTFTLFSETIFPSKEWYATANDSIDVTPLFDFDRFESHNNKEINFTIKKQDSLIAKSILLVNDTLITDMFTNAAPLPLRIRIKKGEKIFFEFHTDDRRLAANLKKANAHIRFSGDSTRSLKGGFHMVIDRSQSIFGPLYRHWGLFSYNGNGESGNAPIDESKLNVDQFEDEMDPIDLSNSTSEEDMDSDFESSGGYRADKEPFVMMYADGKKQRWMGNDDLTFISGDTISSSRMGLDQISAMLPEFSQGAGTAFAVDKITKSNQTSIAVSAAVGINGSKGNSRVIVDYMDMNGDRYPDILGEYKIQYSLPGGGLENTATSHDFEFGHRTKTLAGGVSVGGGFPGSGKEAGNSPKNSVFSAIGEATSVNVSALWSKDDAEYSWLDINGDGLPDRVNADDGTVSLNLGYSFAAAETWGSFEIRKGNSENFAGGLGINIKNKSISAGVGYSRSDNTLAETLQDVNGDGLPDKISVGSSVTVYFNAGNGFASEGKTWGDITQVSKGAATTFSANAAFTIGFPLIPVAPVVKLAINPKVFYSRGFNRQNVQISDLDGDGFPDYLSSTQDGELKVLRSTIGRTNLLKEVKRPLGGSFELSYTQIGNTYEMMTSVWALDTVKMFDGFPGDGADVSITTMKYEGGRYDRHERDFYGFNKVTTYSLDTEQTPPAIYTSVTQTFANDNFYTKGLMLNEVTSDGENRKFLEKENTYKLKDIHSGSDLPAAAINSDNGNAFPALTENIQRFYEGQEEAGKSTKLTYVYAPNGNVLTYTDFGDEGSEDDIVSTIEYHTLSDPYIIANPKSITVTGGGNILRKRQSVIDESTGDIINIKQFLNDDEYTSYDMEYDQYGNLKKIIRPENANGQRLTFEYSYDDEVQTHATRVTNSYGYSSESSYDVRYGQVLLTRDLNGNEIKYELDGAGRIIKIIGPYEKNGGYTIAFEYFQKAEIPWARTRHFDPSNPSNALETAIFVDGLGRVLQTKKDAAIFDGDGKPDKEVMVVSGRVKFDALGRMVSARYPITEPTGSIGDFNHNEDTDADPTLTTYDILTRTLKITLPDQSVTETIYGFGTDREGKNQFSTKSIDPNGKITEQFTDIKQRVTALKNHTADGPIWTSFSYNALNEQIEATDDQGNKTTSVYDNLGRRIERKHPDAGQTTFSYDHAGNLVELTTANLLADGLSVQYVYDHERLTEIKYPLNTENDVKYIYGEAGASDNRAGRIVLQEDASGAQEFFYGPLGETIKTIRTIVIPQHDEQTYVTEWSYDTWNRLTSLTYPDGEKVTYGYNAGGLLRTMTGKKKNVNYNYVDQLGYDKFEQRVFLAYGNGSKTTYSYEADRRRLKNIQSSTAAKRLFMDNVYEYDKVNNILSLTNNAPVPSANLMGGTSEYVFGYDDLYRLTTASGSYRGSNDEHEYTLSMSYNTVGGIVHKNQNHLRKGQQQKKTSYSMQYTYEETQPHAPVHIGTNTYQYDANGNQMGTTDDRTGQQRKILWDEQNRIRSIYDNGSQFHYVYDATGERVLKGKSAGQRIFVNGEWKAGSGQMGNYTVYVSPYLVLQSGGYTKHYFIEGQRIASKLGGGWDNNGKGPLRAGGSRVDYPGKSQKVFDGIVKNLKFLGADGQILTAGKSGKIPPGQINGTGGNTSEAFRYFYHSDHIGNTGFVTDASGEVFQHIEYFPYGEIFVEEHSNTDRVKYLFNGKELDEETGLYYYGARYYDPKISIWASVDPLSEKFDNWTPYRFGFNNPIRYQDPDGKTEKEREAAIAHARKFINANPNPGKSMYGFAGYHAGEPGDPIDCSGLVSQAAKASGFGYLNNIPEQKNGVSNILNQPSIRKLEANQVRRGDIVTMSKRVVWNNIPVGHVALIDRVDRDENGNITGINLLHSKGSAGPVEQYVDFNDANDDYKNLIETFQYWAWDTPEAESKDKQPTKTETPSEKGGDDGKNSSPKWAKSNIIFAHIYFIFTGNDPGLSDRQNDVLNGRNIDK